MHGPFGKANGTIRQLPEKSTLNLPTLAPNKI
jgi:hypothetical protein